MDAPYDTTRNRSNIKLMDAPYYTTRNRSNIKLMDASYDTTTRIQLETGGWMLPMIQLETGQISN